jgi:hypothetical protein
MRDRLTDHAWRRHSGLNGTDEMNVKSTTYREEQDRQPQTCRLPCFLHLRTWWSRRVPPQVPQATDSVSPRFRISMVRPVYLLSRNPVTSHFKPMRTATVIAVAEIAKRSK